MHLNFLFGFLDVGTPELLLIMFVALLLFGGKKLPELAKGLGKAVREFKAATSGVEAEIKRAMDEPKAEQKTAAVSHPIEVTALDPQSNPSTISGKAPIPSGPVP